MRKAIFYTLVVIILLSIHINAVNDNKILYSPDWKTGDSATFQISTSMTKNNVLQRSIEAVYNINVADKNEDGYIFKWLTKSIYPIMNNSQDISGKLYKLEEGLDIKYRTDQYGLFKSFINISEIKQLMKKATEEIIKTEDMDDEEKNIFKNTMNMLLKSDKQINALLAKNINIFHYPYFYFYEYEENVIYTSDIVLPNPWGGQGIPGKLEISAHNKLDGSYVIKVIQSLDKQKAANFLISVLTNIASQSNIELSEEDFMDEVNINDVFICYFKNDSEWPEKIEYTRTTSILNQSRIDKTTIKRK